MHQRLLLGHRQLQRRCRQGSSTDDDRPSLEGLSFEGLSFEGPMAGHGPGSPVRFDMHLYLWKTNPLGAFTVVNPRVGC